MNHKKQQPKKNQQPNFDITKIELWGDLVLIKALRPEIGGGLVNPENYEDKPEWGEIVKVGELVVNPKAIVGKIVRFGKYSTENIRSNGQDYFLVHTEDISGNLP